MKRILPYVVFIVIAIVGDCSSPVKENDQPRPSITISSDTTWAAKGTYHITCDLYLKAFLAIGDSSLVIVDPGVTIYVGSDSGNAILTIGKGTTFTFGQRASIDVGYDYYRRGTLIAHGTAADSIRFTKDSASSHWGYEETSSSETSGGIRIGAFASSQTSLTYCVVEYAIAGINVGASAVEISHCAVRNCIKEGLFFSSNYYYMSRGSLSDSASFLYNAVTANGSYAISIGANTVGKLSTTNDFSDNAKSGIQVFGEDVNTSAIWKKHNVPYVINGWVYLESAMLTILPGCRLEFTQYSHIFVDKGTFIAQGTPTDSIIFTRNIARTNWGDNQYRDTVIGNSDGGIVIGYYANSQTSLRYCVVEYATFGISVDAPAVEISNCSVRNCTYEGIIFAAPYGSPRDSVSFINNVVTANGRYPLYIIANNVGKLSGTGDFSGNARNGIYVSGGNVTTTTVWKKHNVPYIIAGCVNVSNSSGVILTIRPGCRLEFTQGSYLQIGNTNPGTLIAVGLPSDSIVFTKNAGTNWWGYTIGGIWIGNSATPSTSLQYCDISYATTGINSATGVTIQRCQIHDNRYYGIYFTATGLDANVSNNTFSNNPMGDIYQ